MLIRNGPLGAARRGARQPCGGADARPRLGRGRRSIRQAVFRAVYTEVNARLEAEHCGSGR
jgi:hypothetical protein